MFDATIERLIRHERRRVIGDRMPSDPLAADVGGGLGVAQAHLPRTISVDRIVESTGSNVGPVALGRTSELISDLLGL